MIKNTWKRCVNRVTLEGPDLAGKTTLFRNLHAKSGYKWNIQDRSTLSMIAYSRLYNRDTECYRSQLRRDLVDLGNLIIIVIPTENEIRHRYNHRGDEIQDLKSVLKIRSIFIEEADKIRTLPNVLLIDQDFSCNDLADVVKKWIVTHENVGIEGTSRYVYELAKESSGEAQGVSVTIQCCTDVIQPDSKVLQWPQEQDYYENIKSEVKSKIQREIQGDNTYKVKQDPDTTRRFVWASDSCISMLNFFVRENTHTLFATLRSSDAEKILPYDLRFLSHMMYEVEKIMKCKIKDREIQLMIHSAHISKQVNKAQNE